MRPVILSGIGLFCTAGEGAEGAEGGASGRIGSFRARDWVDDRKSLKLMSRSVKLGVAALRMALDDDGSFSDIAPSARGMMVGTTPLGGEAKDLLPALDVATDEAGTLDMDRFAREGRQLIHPLWLVKGLSNNVLGLGSAFHDFRGVNANYCSGDDSGARAVIEGYLAVAEGRAELAVCGGTDSMIAVPDGMMTSDPGEGAAFFVFRSVSGGDYESIKPVRYCAGGRGVEAEKCLGAMGAAGRPVALARSLLRGESVMLGVEGPMALHFA